jgi:hypothetical protein
MNVTEERGVLFLDMDGVINSDRWIRETKPPFTTIGMIDEVAVALLAEIVLATNAQIVVSSSWRVGHSLQDLRALLALKGLPESVEFIGATPVLTPRKMSMTVARGEEITAWLDGQSSRPRRYVVIDDDARAIGSRREHHEHFVRTNPEHGLTRADVERAIRILTPPQDAA